MCGTTPRPLTLQVISRHPAVCQVLYHIFRFFSALLFSLCFVPLLFTAVGRTACARQPCTACRTGASLCTTSSGKFMHSQQWQFYAQSAVALLCTVSSGLADVGGADRQSAAAARGQPLLYLHSLCQGRGHTRVWVPALISPAQQKFGSSVL